MDTPHEQKDKHARIAGEYLRGHSQRRPGFIFVPLLCKNLCSAPLPSYSIGAVSLCLGPKGQFHFSFAILAGRPLQDVWALCLQSGVKLGHPAGAQSEAKRSITK